MDSDSTSHAQVAAQVADLLGGLANSQGDLGSRRRDLVLGLASRIGADFGHWAWGRGHPDRGPVAPAAIIDFGMTPEQKAAYIRFGLSPELDRYIRAPITAVLKDQATHLRADLYPDSDWPEHELRKSCLAVGIDEWLHAVRYCGPDTWANFWMGRQPGKPPFSDQHKRLVDLMLRHVPLLQTADESQAAPPLPLDGLTARQRAVMLMLLDGQPRKRIASLLKISEHTVNAHVKAVFRHFNISSVTELGALFLRGQSPSQ